MKHAVFPNVVPSLAKEIILREEAAYRESIDRAVKITLEKDARFVFLAGPSCSGKTTTATEAPAVTEAPAAATEAPAVTGTPEPTGTAQ